MCYCGGPAEAFTELLNPFNIIYVLFKEGFLKIISRAYLYRKI
jgi:hypothetical protein